MNKKESLGLSLGGDGSLLKSLKRSGSSKTLNLKRANSKSLVRSNSKKQTHFEEPTSPRTPVSDGELCVVSVAGGRRNTAHNHSHTQTYYLYIRCAAVVNDFEFYLLIRGRRMKEASCPWNPSST